MPKIITISREFGSGGRELGKRMSDYLGFAYFDKEILSAVAEQTETDEQYTQKLLEGRMLPHVSLHFGRSLSYYSPLTQKAVSLMVAEQKVIKALASRGDCIIVGRGANVILENRQPFTIFVYADMASKVARCRKRAMEDEKLSDKELEKKIRQVDLARASGQNASSDFKWGQKEYYHLCVNTSAVSIKEITPIIGEYAKKWLGENGKKGDQS